jgi:outer membrane receptor for ferrienterochelin and colicins
MGFHKFYITTVVLVSQLSYSVPLSAELANFNQLSITELRNMDLAQLFEVVIIETASGKQEKLFDAPATMMVITAEQIAQRGYQHLTEVLQDLPGFDVNVNYGLSYTNSYQRGYRLPFTSRTLLMFNGIVDNLIWTHEAFMSRQYPFSNIKQIEVLYGPASAIYGPNAFLGIINVITYDGSELENASIKGNVNISVGSFNSKAIDASIRGRLNEDLSFAIAAKGFKSDGEDLSGRWGFVSNEQLSNRDIWGPLLDFEHLGKYENPAQDYGVMANLNYKGLKLGLIHWKSKIGYGPYYASDRVQPNVFWNRDNDHYYLEYQDELYPDLQATSHLSYSTCRCYGSWAEAEPDWNPNMENYSYVSLTQWNSVSNSWLFKQDLEYQFNPNLILLGGIKYQRSELTKSYDAPGYWEPAFSSTTPAGAGIVHSSAESYTLPLAPNKNMPAENLINTTNIGTYIQATFDLDAWRFNLGARYDKNSIYGRVINPRSSVIYRYDDNWTFKLLHGRASQEPAPIQLWGGWSGRLANEELKPERVQNLEFITQYRKKNLLHEVSIYRSHYSDVIKEEADNAGERTIRGLEYKLQTDLPNPFHARDMELYFNYTYSRPTSHIYYDKELAQWLLGKASVGDIAPHKWNLGLNLPVSNNWSVNLRGNYISEREPYLRNPLRGNRIIDNYFVLNAALHYEYQPVRITLKILNALDKKYFHPGPEGASAGDDFTQRSLGYQNSLIPQVGRSFWLNLNWQF